MRIIKFSQKGEMDMYDIMETAHLIALAQTGDRRAEEELLKRYEPLINSLSVRYGAFFEDCKQNLMIEFVLCIRRFDIERYINKKK
ncbi:helix-turn-helix domain-containing protein [Clostridium tyrobutyricum]|nr:helix-turn-helix domain-containing protein [Clostridium tyrobutyricum]